MAKEIEQKKGPARYSTASNVLVFRRVMTGDIAKATYNEKIEAVFEAQRACAMAAAALAAQPLPLVDVPVLAAIQLRMIQAIGKIHGTIIDKASMRELMDLYGLGIAAQIGLVSAAKLIPGLGSLAAPSVAYALTLAVGELADHYALHGRGVLPRPLTAAWLLDQNVVKTVRTLVGKRGQELRTIAGSGDSLSEKLEQLRAAYTKDLMSEAEYQKLKADVMATFTARA